MLDFTWLYPQSAWKAGRRQPFLHELLCASPILRVSPGPGDRLDVVLRSLCGLAHFVEFNPCFSVIVPILKAGWLRQ